MKKMFALIPLGDIDAFTDEKREAVGGRQMPPKPNAQQKRESFGSKRQSL